MKKIIVICTILVCSICSCFSQHRLGGDLGLGIGYADKDLIGSVNIEPRYTNAVSDKIEVGASLALGTTFTSFSYSEKENATFFWAINPLARFRLIGNEKIGFWLETKGTFGTESVKESVYLQWGINVNPVCYVSILRTF